MSELLATSPALPGEAATVEGRLADIIAGADCEVCISDYRLSDSDKAKVVEALRRAAPSAGSPASAVTEGFQYRVRPWMLACFGPIIPFDKTERNHRFLEEALELVQSIGCTQSEAHQLVDYVFGREIGETPQEVGGVMVTLAALCEANELDMTVCGETELARIWTKVDKIRAKQAAKPKHSPLPEHVPCTAMTDDEAMRRLSANEVACYRWPDDTVIHKALRNAFMDGAALSAAPASAWRDISTAPKDGTVILLASTDERGSKNLIECSWWSEERCWIDNGRRGKPDEYEADWYQVDNTDFSFSRPTHWRMPLSRPRKER